MIFYFNRKLFLSASIALPAFLIVVVVIVVAIVVAIVVIVIVVVVAKCSRIYQFVNFAES